MSSSRKGWPSARRRFAGLVLVAVAALPGSEAASATGEHVVPTARGQADASGDPSSYRLFRNPDGSPVRFDPCEPLGVRINAPTEAAAADAREALGRLAAVTGLRFVLEGSTDFVPSRAQRTLPGTDLVISWAPPGGRPGGSDVLGSGQLGTGGWVTAGKRTGEAGVVWRATGGFAVLDSDADDRLAPGFGPGLTRGALLLHELSHALGVDHVDDPDQLMAPVLQERGEPVAFGAGDLAALRLVGADAGCLPG